MKKQLYSIIVTFLGVFSLFNVNAQNPNAVHYYVLNPQLINGAAIVNSDRYSISSVYKQLPNESGNLFINIPAPFRKLFIGIHIENYQTHFVTGNTNSLTAAYRITRKRGILGFACTYNFDTKTYLENKFAIERKLIYNGPNKQTRNLNLLDLSAYYYNHKTAYGLSILNINEPFLKIDSIHRVMDFRSRPFVIFNYMRRFGGSNAIIPYFTWYRSLIKNKDKEFHFMASYAFEDSWEVGGGVKGGLG